MKNKKVIAIIICTLCLLISFLGLIMGICSINASGFGQIGVIFILPSIFAISIITIDLLITLDIIKKGLIFSYISTLIKLGIAIFALPNLYGEIIYEMNYGVSNLLVYLFLIIPCILLILPSVFNIKKLKKRQ